uniref:DNA-directed RNA polymerase n=1 Tax=Marvania geminata TaxID=97105 RepID=A0A097KR85_9CHLO|nr:beta'' subunit of RNA polymerase [Marvania geminata]AIT95697.1 beta'' subunit of RNA polymerase [Marvania geminata]
MNISKSKHREEIFFNACFDKNSVKNLVSWFLNTYGEKATLNFLESLKTLGFHQATQAGVSLGLDDLQIPQEKPSFITKAHIATHKIEQQVAAGSLTSVEKSQCLIDTWNQTSDLLRQAAVQNFRKTNLLNPVYMMAFSGARGNVSQVRQLVGMRGLMADPQGAILEFPIQSNFREGLTVTEYLISCYGARKGLVDTALRTATSGYLTRRLVDSAQQAVISMRDCGTLRATVLEGKNLESRLIGRVLANSLAVNDRNHAKQALEAQLDFETKISFGRNHLICATDAKILSKNYTQIGVRSPLTCESTTSVCQLCYGWNLATGKLVQMGEAVGVIAAQSIGEPGTQLTMRTFHTGGVGVFANQALQPILAPYKGKLIFHHPLTGHFIRTPYGKIAYMVKQSPIQGDRIICTLEPFSKVDRVLTIREQDLTPGSLLFIKHGEHVEAKHVLFQISQLKLTKQTLPESSHPVYSPAEGQIFLESMNFFIEKEIPTTKEKEKVKAVFSSKESGVQRMKKLGTFWVLAASNQHEIHGAESASFSSRSKAPQQTCSFLETGDFISKNSILFQYNFYSSSKTQLQKIQSKLTFGVYTLQIPIETIAFFQKYYRFTSPNGTFVYRKQSTKNGLLIWYPAVREKRKDSVSRRRLLISKARQNNAVATPIDNALNSSSVPRSGTMVVYRHIPSLYTQIFKTVTLQGKKNQDAQNSQDSQELSQIQGMVFGIQLFFPKTQFFNNKYLRKNFLPCFVLNQDTREKNLISSDFLIDIFQKDYQQKTFVSEPTSLLSTQGWVFFSPKKITPGSFLRRQFIPTGLIFETLCFPKCSISVKTLSSVSFGQRKKFQNYFQKRDWYAPTIFGDQDTARTKKSLKYEIQKNVCPIRNGVIWYSPIRQNNKKGLLQKTFQNFVSLKTFFLIQSVVESRLPNQQEIQKQAAILTGKSLVQNPHTALFSKQKPTKIQLKPKIHWKLQFSTELQNILRGAAFEDAKWISHAHLWKAHATIKNISDHPHKHVQFQNVSTTYSRGISVFQYQFATFKNPKKFTFIPGYQNWISPIQPFTQGLVKIQTSGEFLLKTQTTQGTSLSLLRKDDLLTLKTDTSQFSKLGSLIRWGDEIEPGKACEYNGQVIKKTTNSLTLRLGSPFLAPLRCILHVSQNTLVQKNDLLITLKSRQLQTEDIVQGIPKIEQLFEARESLSGEILSDTVHIRLKNAYKRELESLNLTTHWSIAVEKSFLEAQHFLVEQILDAYETQGVKISEKHVEVIVRQMTNRVRILDPGETGLLEGEVVQHTWIKKFNQQIRGMGLREAMYEPLVLGISKSVLQSESFLLAASFQEVSRVLVRSALSKKRDFLHGLHENVIIGQMIPAGTGLVSQGTSKFLS